MGEATWRIAARRDLLALVAFIADDNPAAAQTLKDEIEAKVALLPVNPRLYRAGRLPGTREMVVRSNYIVVYMEQGGMISVLRIMHAARKWP